VHIIQSALIPAPCKQWFTSHHQDYLSKTAGKVFILKSQYCRCILLPVNSLLLTRGVSTARTSERLKDWYGGYRLIEMMN
jgi:hypothetical protein